MKDSTLSGEYLTVGNVGEYLNISLSKAYQLVHRKDFPVSHFGGSIRVPRVAFLAWVEMNTYTPKNLEIA